MSLICPLCNGLYTIQYNCISCNTSMEDQGARVNFYDDYSPYLMDDITSSVDSVERTKCLHVFLCPKCGNQTNYAVERREY